MSLLLRSPSFRVCCPTRLDSPISIREKHTLTPCSAARLFQLRLNMRQKDRPRVILEGFKRDVSLSLSVYQSGHPAHAQEFEKVKRTLDEFFHIKVESKDISLRGWNWGKALVQGEEEQASGLAYRLAQWTMTYRRRRDRVPSTRETLVRDPTVPSCQLEHCGEERGGPRVQPSRAFPTI